MQSLTDMFMAKAVVIVSWVYAAAKSLQSCLTLSDPMDCSPPGSSIHGIFLGKSTGVGVPLPSPSVLSTPPLILCTPGMPKFFQAPS